MLVDSFKEKLKIKNIEEDKTFFEIISKVFESGLINKTVNCNIEINKKGLQKGPKEEKVE